VTRANASDENTAPKPDDERAGLDRRIDELRAVPSGERGFELLTELGSLLSRRYGLDAAEADRDEAIGVLRAAEAAPCPPDAEPAWIRLELAWLLLQRAERAKALGDIEAAIEYTRDGLADLAHHIDETETETDPDISLAFQNLGVAHLLRAQFEPAGADEDLAEAADAFSRAMDLMPGFGPALGGVTARYGVVLAAIVQRAVEGLDLFGHESPDRWNALAGQVSAALESLDAGWRDMPADDPYRPFVRYWRAVTRATRFTYFGGGTGDRDEALTDLAAILELPECDDVVADVCHLYVAFLHLYGSAPAELRNRRPSLRDLARLIAVGGAADREAARVAREHLDRVTGSDPARTSLVSALRAMTVLAVDGQDISDEGIARFVAHLGEARDLDPEDADLGLVRDLMEIVQMVRRGRPEDLDGVADALTRIVGDLGDGHPFQQMLRGMLGQFLDMRADDLPSGRSASPEEREAALELLEHVLAELPDDHPDRALTLSRLGAALSRSMEHGHSPERLERVHGMLLEAVERPAADRENEALNHFLLVLVDRLRGMLGHGSGSLSDALGRLKRVAELLPPEHPIRHLFPGFLASLLMQRHLQAGGLEHLDAADHYAHLMSETDVRDGRAQGDLHAIMEWLRTVTPLAKAQWPLDADLLSETSRALRALAARWPEGHPLRAQVDNSARTLESAQGYLTAAGPDPLAGQADGERLADALESEVANARVLGRGHPIFPAELASAGFHKAQYGFIRRDLGLLDEGLALLAEAYEAADVVWPLRSWLLGVLGWALLMRYELGRDRKDLNNAIDRLEESVRAGEAGTADALGSVAALSLSTLSTAYHMRGDPSLDDRRRAGETGLAALRARAWSVMLQNSTEHAFVAALAAAGEGAVVAHQCAADGFTALAVEALEWGRAMVLHTATTDVNLPALLREGGHDDLAAEWEGAMGETDPAPWILPSGPVGPDGLEPPLAELRLPSDLRERVREAIQESEIERRLFSPAVPAEIATTLREAGAAALAYLVPRDDGRSGLALVVDAAGQVRRVGLPRLMTGPRSRVEAFVQAQRDREQADPGTPAADRAHRQWRHALGDLCDWAWTAVMEPVLDAAGAPRSRARVVLVPVGELGAVPWHAARRTVGDGARRYACQDAVISYAASARQFIEARRHGHRPWASTAALVRVGGSSPPLYWASKEIEQIHRRHYRDGELLGGRRRPGEPPSPHATADNVRRLLPGPRSGSASLLHLGCHAHSAPRPVDSHLLLAGGEVLGMTDILRRARVRPSGVPGGLVVLAACGSDLTSRDHDEALTLSTAFLAAGAVGVVGARWPVDDLPTALFMTMFHHYLNAGYDDPAVALRAAQLWMLNPRRRVPADLSAELADLLDAAPLGEPESWAAFTYQGR
jgi:tetratricopeptide (TPR) repeat protein